jgi:filamentous hemagglutinin family protein
VNLFHSFGDFNVPNNNIANFLNDSGIGTTNILGRVTGGGISNIFGMIQTTGFEGANLFLINPTGFLFGPNATVQVGGMVSFTSADYLRLADGVRFNAIANPAADILLSAAPVAAFGFLGSNPRAITIQGSQLTVAEGTGISLIGGNIMIQCDTPDGGTAQPARLSAPNGKIQLASAASPGEFDAATLQPLRNVNQASFTSFGSVSLPSGSNINVSGEQTVSIRGGQVVLSVNNAVLSTAQSPGPPELISLSPSSSIISSNAEADPGADVQLTASDVQMEDASIQSLTTGAGSGGAISITAVPDGGPTGTAGNVDLKGGQIQTASLGPGTVGDIQINSSTLSLTDGALIDTLLVPNPVVPGQPGAGTIAIMVSDSIFVTGQHQGTIDFLPSVAGLPTFTNLPSGIYSENFSANPGSRIVIQTPSLTLQPGLIRSHAFRAGAGGDLSLLLGELTLRDGGLIGNIAFGEGATGSVQIRASESIIMSGFLPGAFQQGPLVNLNVSSNIANTSGAVYLRT